MVLKQALITDGRKVVVSASFSRDCVDLVHFVSFVQGDLFELLKQLLLLIEAALLLLLA